MKGEECTFLHLAPMPHAENIWKTPKEVAEHNARATIQNFANILGYKGMLQR